MFRELRRRSNRYLIPSLAICLSAYFIYHLLQGGRGVLALRHIEEDLTKAQQEFQDLKNKHDSLSHRVNLLKSDSLSKDLLEERSKDTLGFSHPQERVLLSKEVAEE